KNPNEQGNESKITKRQGQAGFSRRRADDLAPSVWSWLLLSTAGDLPVGWILLHRHRRIRHKVDHASVCARAQTHR
uniref:Uncharacterized protein n=1 Tax=Periophthalmus magnuspinnatus TaxID=409849 RepID=A0A3B4A545_9GOBI